MYHTPKDISVWFTRVIFIMDSRQLQKWGGMGEELASNQTKKSFHVFIHNSPYAVLPFTTAFKNQEIKILDL